VPDAPSQLPPDGDRSDADGLGHVRVLEVDGGVAASFATKLLADLGADVIKLEPDAGDPVRGRQALFLGLNTGKRSRRDEPAARAELLAEADIVIGGPSTAALGGPGAPGGRDDLVVCSITPFGLTGPYAEAGYRATELGINHGGGWAWLSPGASPWPDEPPLRPFGHQAELQSGIAAAMASLAAYDRASVTGRGEHIDLSCQSHVASMLEAAFIAWTYPGWDPDRLGVRTLNPWKIFRCRDGLIFLVTVEQDQWLRFVELMGSPDWAQEEVFATPQARNDNADVLNLLVEQWTEQQSVEWLWHEGQARRICFAPVFRMADLEGQAHLRERRFFATVDQPGHGRLVLPGAPCRLTPDPWALRPSPGLHADPQATFDPRTATPASRSPDAPGGAPQPAATASAAPAGLPLEGVRVVDFSWVWAGPFCTMQLAHLGADVIKVESDTRLCLGRRLPFHPPGVEPTPNTSGYFNQWNQGKRSVVLDLGQPRGVDLAKQLIAEADVVVDNFAVGVMDRLGLGAEELLRLKPDLVVASISGYGQTGPCRAYMGYGPTAAPLSGLADLTGYPGEGPAEVGIAFGDPASGIAAAWGIVAALVARRRSGRGRRVDVAMWEAALAFQPDGWMPHALGQGPLGRIGNRDPLWAPHGCYRCADDRDPPRDAGAWVTIACTDEADWRALCEVAAADGVDLADDARFADVAARKADEDALDAIIGGWTASRDRWQLTRRLQAAGVAAFPSLSPQDLAADPHLAARGFLEQLDHPEAGRRMHAGIPWRLAAGPNGVRAPAPLLGQHTDEVLGDVLGLGDEERDRLRADGIIGGPVRAR
jgi:crotonobetainyl-CoA:carnitine CoA-transferase CaiB-like acyl-CoA transferase